jgi:hypothetical protein
MTGPWDRMSRSRWMWIVTALVSGVLTVLVVLGLRLMTDGGPDDLPRQPIDIAAAAPAVDRSPESVPSTNEPFDITCVQTASALSPSASRPTW